MSLTTTLGQLLINEALPEELRDYNATWDKKHIGKVFQTIAEKYPERFPEISKKLLDLGRKTAFLTGGFSVSIDHLKPMPAALAARQKLNAEIDGILDGPGSPEEQEKAIVAATQRVRAELPNKVYQEALAAKNPLALQVASGARGNPIQLNTLLGGDLLYVDNRDREIPFPVTKSYSEGLSPAEYFAGSFGARKGLVDVKLGTAKTGYYSKMLNQAAHRLLVTALDDENEQENDNQYSGVRGLPVEVDDEDNIGALLARETAGYPRNTVITPRVLADIRNKGVARMLVRSPLIGSAGLGGVYARDVGVRERGGLAPPGDMVGLAAAQAISERLTQGALGSKHSGGVSGAAKAASGFEYLNQLISVPETYKGGAAHSQLDGRVEAIRPAPAGGNYVVIGGQEHYVSPNIKIHVKPGDEVEAGDMISEGLPNPAQVVKHKGIGEGSLYFLKTYYDALKNSGIPAHRRNIELVTRGLIDHVEMIDDSDDYIPGDTISYRQLERSWKPREGYRTATPKEALGKYLERPVLHYSIGTKIRKSMLPQLEEFGVNQLDVHDEPPPFQPVMIRALENIGHDPDPFTRLLGSYQKKSLLDAVHRGHVSDEAGTSFVPSFMRGVDFGIKWPQSVIKPIKPQ